MNEYQFTSDWFSTNIASWQRIFAAGVPTRVLEIGSYEGRSTVWIIENLLTFHRGSSITAVDAWAEGPEDDQRAMTEVESRFDRNMAVARQAHPGVQVEKLKGRSADCLASLISQGHRESFDFIYVDGSHKAPDVLTDVVLSFHLCRVGGLIFCDDYLGAMDRELSAAPKIAIDSFFGCFHRKLQIIPDRLYQMYFRKISN